MDNPQLQVSARFHPNARFLFSHPAHFIALGAGSGLSRWAPGTVGTLWAWASFVLLAPHLNDTLWAATLGIGTLVAWWASAVAARNLGIMDPGCIVVDEIIAFWLVLWLVMPTGFWGQLAAFAVFRFFDAVKPPPVGWADGLFKGFGPWGGWGIVFDDLVAAFMTLLVIAFWRF